jgi:hypothetical protein
MKFGYWPGGPTSNPSLNRTLDGGIMISATETQWQPFRAGTILGETGSDAGVILRDEEHTDGARITLERAETSGVYWCNWYQMAQGSASVS